MQLTKYDDFIGRVNALGFMAFSDNPGALPSLSGETPGRLWHTGDYDTDPWRWKDRAAEEKKLAFGCILGGHKGFIAPSMYNVFIAAYRPRQSMEKRRYDGLVGQTSWELWKLFGERDELDTGEIRRLLGVTKKKGSGRADSAISELQRHYYIAVAGSRQKRDKCGQPYGWHINVYKKAEDWAPKEWTEGKPVMSREEAIEKILDTGVSIGENVDRDRLRKQLGFV